MWSGKKRDTSYSGSLIVELSSKWLRKIEQASRFLCKQNAVISRLARTFYAFARAWQWNLRPKCLRQLAIFKEPGECRRANVVRALVCFSELNVSGLTA